VELQQHKGSGQHRVGRISHLPRLEFEDAEFLFDAGEQLAAWREGNARWSADKRGSASSESSHGVGEDEWGFCRWNRSYPHPGAGTLSTNAGILSISADVKARAYGLIPGIPAIKLIESCK
jgi:hypothetical protein